MFNPNKSELQKSPQKVKQYVKLLEKALGNGFKIIGILEIGSFAKGEAVPSSDCDTRVFVESPNFYAWQTAGGRNFDKMMKQLEGQNKEMQKKEDFLPRKEFNYFSFNDPIADEIRTKIGINIEFGVVDFRFSKFCLADSENKPTNEMSLLFQSNIVYDPKGYLKELRENYKNKRQAALIKFYKKRYLEALPEEIYSHLKPHLYDTLKIRKSGQIQWVKWAVGSLRNAAATENWLKTGKFIYKKCDVLKFYKKVCPKDSCFINELYSWKCNKNIRRKMLENFIHDPKPLFRIFSKKTKRIETIIRKIDEIVSRETISRKQKVFNRQ